MRIISVFLILLSTAIPALSQPVRLPAEWEQQEGVYLTWFGHERRDSVLCRVIEALQPSVSLTLNIMSLSEKPAINAYLSQFKIDTAGIDFVEDPDTDFWTRDPLFFVNEAGVMKMVCFNYSMYGIFPDLAGVPMPDEIKKIGEYDERLASQLHLPVIKSDFIFEGGGIETNGRGTFMIIKEMALQRNPGKTIEEIEQELKRTLGARKIIWLKEGFIEDKTFKHYGPFYKNYFGAGANMHIDELCRFVNETTVLLPEIPFSEISKSPADSINYFMLEENLKILQKATTADGQPLTIVRIPVPETEELKYTMVLDSLSEKSVKRFGFGAGDTIYRLPAIGYINYFVSNETVLIPKYWMPGMSLSQKHKDEEARLIIQKMFPGRRVIQIYAISINRGGGGIHCMTHEQPKILKQP